MKLIQSMRSMIAAYFVFFVGLPMALLILFFSIAYLGIDSNSGVLLTITPGLLSSIPIVLLMLFGHKLVPKRLVESKLKEEAQELESLIQNHSARQAEVLKRHQRRLAQVQGALASLK